MHMFRNGVLVFTALAFLAVGCNRNTGTDERDSSQDVEILQPAITDANLITPEDPFRNQPNEFCTVIRKLDISYYAPEKSVDDVTAFPQKYCLLDVCLDGPSSNGNVVNLGEGNDVVTSSYELIKVFDSYEEAKAYAEKYKIVDVLFGE